MSVSVPMATALQLECVGGEENVKKASTTRAVV